MLLTPEIWWAVDLKVPVSGRFLAGGASIKPNGVSSVGRLGRGVLSQAVPVNLNPRCSDSGTWVSSAQVIFPAAYLDKGSGHISF